MTTTTVLSISVAASRMRRARNVLIGAARRRGTVRSSWVVTILAGLFLLL